LLGLMYWIDFYENKICCTQMHVVSYFFHPKTK
jgi:hypothetical protein